MKTYKELLENKKKPKPNELVKKYLAKVKKDISVNNKAELGAAVIAANGREIVDDFYMGDLPKASSAIGSQVYKVLDKMGLISRIKKAKHFKVIKK